MAAFHVKRFKLTRKQIKTYENEDIADNRQVMLEDGLQDIDNLKNISFEDEQIDTLGAKYLKMVHYVSFSDLSVYTVESPISEHGDLKSWKQRI